MYFSPTKCTFQQDCVDIARPSSARGRQTTLRWQKQVFIHTQLSRAYLALARLSCLKLWSIICWVYMHVCIYLLLRKVTC